MFLKHLLMKWRRNLISHFEKKEEKKTLVKDDDSRHGTKCLVWQSLHFVPSAFVVFLVWSGLGTNTSLYYDLTVKDYFYCRLLVGS